MELDPGSTTRRQFVRAVSFGAAALALPRLLQAKKASPITPDVFDLLQAGGPLVLASDLGCPILQDDLKGRPDSAARLVQGLGEWSQAGLAIRGGEAIVEAPSLPTLGNRSTYARVEFCFEDSDSTIELRLVTTRKPVHGRMLNPLRARLAGGAFVLLDLENNVIAGDPSRVVFAPRPGEWHSLELVTFQKSVHARISGCSTVLHLPDKLRFIPGDPGVRAVPASRSRVLLRNWDVSGVGPRSPLLGAIGDSVTAGLQFRTEADDYVHRVTQALGQEYELNTGSGGANTGQDKARFRFEIAPFKPRIVWIESASNDLFQGLSAEAIFANLGSMAAQITWGGKAVLSTVMPRPDLTPKARSERRKLNGMIRTNGLPFVDRDAVCASPDHPEQLRPDFDSGDGTHPNLKGSDAIVAAAIPVIRNLL